MGGGDVLTRALTALVAPFGGGIGSLSGTVAIYDSSVSGNAGYFGGGIYVMDVRTGAALSLQSHMHRSEHWIVVSGTARVTVGDEVKLLSENQSVYIPLGARHRMENPGKVPVVMIEVQTGSYLGEDDIIRYEDVYARK